MTVRGVGFVSGSLVQWNGQALATTFVSAETLHAVACASSLAQAGTGVVTVVNPAPGGGSSNLAFFEVTRATPTAIIFEIRTYTPTNTNSLVAGDFNGDGKLDLAVSTGATLSILLGKGDGTFNVTTFPTTAQFVGTLVAGDFNGDGRLDLAENSPLYIDGNTYVGVQTQSDVAFYPALLTFPPQNVGTTSAPKTVKFANIGIVPVNISKIEAGSAFAETNDCPATLPVSGSCTVTVTFTPTFVGLTGGSVNVNDDALGVQQRSGLSGIGK
jgi:hypothetical protein